MAREYAAGINDLSAFDSDGKPPLSQWDEWSELAADISDAVNSQTIALISSKIERGKPRPKFKPAPRPMPAMQRAVKAREKELESLMENGFMGMLGGE